MPMLGYIRRYFVHYDEEKNFVFAVREPVSKNGKAVTWTLLQRVLHREMQQGRKPLLHW